MKAAVVGSPISHSRSPELHRAAYAELGLPWTYERHEVEAGQLRSFLASHSGEFRGLSLTMPLKDEAFDVAEIRDEAAIATAACNTLVFGEQINGFNTDVPGFIAALDHYGYSSVESATIIGTGATARSAATAMHWMGVPRIDVIGRRPEALREFVAWCPGSVTPRQWSDGPLATELTISAVTRGATDEFALPESCGLLFDVVYAPWPTVYASRWIEAAGTVMSGLDLLIHQAAEQVLLMTGVNRQVRNRIVSAMYAVVAQDPA